ncbi:MAG TPA: ATP-binding protein, partial [Candidatus Angelobacter sp.]
MITEDTLRKSLALRTETKNLDYKQSMNWASASNEDKCKLVKDILAMMNTPDGGQIVIGVEDNTYNLLGVNDGDAASFDITKVND